MLPSSQRLRANRDFRRVYERGRSYPHKVAVLYVMRRSGDYAAIASGFRIGFVVSKKQGGAVVRNRIKRRLREAVRARLADLGESPYDLILIGRSQALGSAWSEVQEAVDELLRRAGLVRDRLPAGERLDGGPQGR